MKNEKWDDVHGNTTPDDRMVAFLESPTDSYAILQLREDVDDTVDEIQDILGISRTSAYNLVKKKVFHSVRIGGSIRISKKSFDEWLDHQM